MATFIKAERRTLVSEQRVLLRGISWEGYETMLKLIGDQPLRLTQVGTRTARMGQKRPSPP
jgi:hypothetical protein